MRVNELSKQIGKQIKEVLEILQKNHFERKKPFFQGDGGTGRSSQMLPCRSKETDDSVKDRYRKGGNKSSGRYKERAVRGREERGGEDN